jgi:thiamine biosynthesis protein ThiI
MDKNDIVTMAKHIDTYDISILPYEDCCTIFVPKHPQTKPRLEKVLEQEEKLPLQELIDQAVSQIETLRLD